MYIDEIREEVICVYVKFKFDKWCYLDWCCNFCYLVEFLRFEYLFLYWYGGLISNKFGKGYD